MADIFEIAGRIHSTSQEEVTTVANEVLDERLNKKQDVINREIDEDLNTPSSGLKDRVETLEHEVSFEGDIQVENTPQGVVSGSGKVTTANAVRGAIDMATGYFECGTAAGTAAKVVTGAAVAGFVLPSVGGCLKIKMTNRNTADDATLNINGTGAMPLFYDGQRASAANSWDAGETIEVYFDGTNYMANNVAGGGDGGIFDISAYNAGATYADLSTAIAAVPVAKRKGGMSVKFVQTSDNNYMQYRYMGTEVTGNPNPFLDVANWQGVDAEPTPGSKNLVDSNGIKEEFLTIGEKETSTVSFNAGDSYLWKVLFPNTLENGEWYRCNINHNSPSPLKFSLCKGTTRDVLVLYYAENKFKVPDDGLTLCVRCDRDIQSDTGDITVTLEKVSNGIVSDTQNLADSVAKLTTGKNFLTLLDIKGSARYINNQEGERIQFTEYSDVSTEFHVGNKHQSYIYDVSNLNGKKVLCYSMSRNNDAIYTFTVNYNLIISDPINSFSTNVLEYKVGSNSKGTIFTLTVPNGANQLILIGSDLENAACVEYLPNKTDEYVLENIEELNTKTTELEGTTDLLQEDVFDLKNILNGGYLEAVATVDDKAVGTSNAGNYYGMWFTISFKDYEGRVSGTKYVCKIWKTDSFIGKELRLHAVVRNNVYQYLFVTDYTKIPTEANVELFESVYVDGVAATATLRPMDFSIQVPQNGNYLVVLGTDLDSATVFFDGGQSGGDDIIGLNDKEKTLTKINNAKREGRFGNTLSGISPLMLLHFSDIHGSTTHLERIKTFYDYYKSFIDDVICTGDMVYGKLTDGMTFWDASDAKDFLTCIGNHETYGAGGNTDPATPSDVYNTIIKPYIDNWGVIQPQNAEANALCYYYKDYASSHIRLIVLDCYGKGDSSYLTNENTWFASILADAITQNLSVIVAIHQCTGSVSGFECAFNAYQTGYTTASFSNDFKTSVDTFINNGGDFIAWFGGHGHIDVCGTVIDHPAQTIIAIDTASNAQSGYSDTYRSPGIDKRSYDCFNLLTVDTYQKLIKIIRIGADVDSWLRKKDVLTIQYASSAARTISGPEVIKPYE